MGKLLIQALQLLILGIGFLLYLDAQSSTVIWLTIVASVAFGVVAGIVLDWMRAKRK